MKKHLVKLTIGTMIIVSAVSLAACGGAPAAQPAPAAPAPVTTPSQVDPAALRAKGEQIYQTTVGCKNCHGADGKGLPNVAPDVRGESADDIKRALGGDAMSFIRMTNDDVEAVAAYLKSLQ
ncbi:MAG: cytochrome c [Dehalococcoidia bacterium]|nr:cytochrome c [Dehalococcoidia bacterium]